MNKKGGAKKSEEAREISLWDKWVDCENPDTFGFLELAKDGGFSEVSALYNASRWISALVLILFVVYNIYSLACLDIDFMTNPTKAAQDLGTDLETIDKFYYSRNLISFVGPMFGQPADMSPVRVIGALELLGLSYFICEGLMCTFLALTTQGFRKWNAIATIFWETLPTLSVYSAMRLLYNIVPTVLISRVTEILAGITEAKSEGKPLGPHFCKLIVWILSVVFGFIVGFDTFLMKLRVVSAAASQKDLDSTVALSTVQFLIQVMGVVQLGSFVRLRLFKFIFGGEDAILQDEEIILMETWNALLAKRMCRDLSTSGFLAVMMSFSDEDFQGLVLNENAEKKKAALGE